MTFLFVKKTERQRAEWRGRVAEYYAMLWLRMQGYHILKHRYRCHFGEIDIIACKKDYLIAVEVKYRTTFDTALLSLSLRQQQRIVRSLLNYQQVIAKNTRQFMRFDIVCSYGLKLKHLKNAWCAY